VQGIFDNVAEIGIGTELSLTVTLMESESEQYLTEEIVTFEGKQSLRSTAKSCPVFVNDLPVQVID